MTRLLLSGDAAKDEPTVRAFADADTTAPQTTLACDQPTNPTTTESPRHEGSHHE